MKESVKLNGRDILHMRLRSQRLAGHPAMSPGQVVAHLGAVQAQDLLGSKWGVALRTHVSVAEDIDRAIAEKEIVRTWPMRGTLHFVDPATVRWMLTLLAPGVVARAGYRNVQLGLDSDTYSRARDALGEGLIGGVSLTRPEMLALLERAGVRTDGQRGYHLLWQLAQEGLLCFGPMRGSSPTFVLLDEWLPPAEPLEKADALSRLAFRYFAGHGPATDRDLARWAGITLTDARSALASVAARLTSCVFEGAEHWYLDDVGAAGPEMPRAWLLPAFDEYTVGYKDRRLALDEHHEKYHTLISSNGMFAPTIVIDGLVVGTWKRKLGKREVSVTALPFRRLNAAHKKLVREATKGYGTYLGLPASVEFG